MKSFGRLAGVVVLWLVAVSPVSAEVPARDFLEALRDRGYYDVALEYLDAVANDPLAPEALRETVPLEKASVLIDASRLEPDREVREQQLDEAEKLLSQFIAAHAEGHAKANEARNQLGALIIERARVRLDQAQKGNDSVANLREARQFYERAAQVFTELQARVKAELEQFPKVLDVTDPEQAKMAKRRTQLRADYLQTQLLAAAIQEEIAETAEPDSKPYRDYLTEAAQRYESIYKDYRMRLAGLYARMYQGRANQKLGKLRDALGFYMELLDQPDEPDEFRVLKTETLKLAMECWLDPAQNKYLIAIRQGTEWILKARPNEDRHPDWLYLRLSVAKAYLRQADDVQEKAPQDRRTINNARSEARKLAGFVARYDSEYQREAQEMLALLGGPDLTDQKVEPINFAQARKAGKEAFDKIGPADNAVRQLAASVAQLQDGEEKNTAQQELVAARQTLATNRADAIHYFRMALQLAEPGTSSEDVNVVRYLLCYLYYLEQDYFRAAIMGEFVAQRFPDTVGARQCAKIAMACYLLLHEQAVQQEAESTDFEAHSVIAIAEYIVSKWPGSKESEEALATLIPFMINARQLDKARAFLAKIPSESARRGESERKVGKALWEAYLEEVKQISAWQKDGVPPGTDLAEHQIRADTLKNDAYTVLKDGVGRLATGHTMDVRTFMSVLSLAQAAVEVQQPRDAIQALEAPEYGALTLVRADHAARRQVPGVAEETFRTALRAYIGALGTGADSDAMIQKAQQIMDELKQEIGTSPEGRKRLVSVYVGLAHNLEQQLSVASPEVKQALSKGFETFLSQLSVSADELDVLNWVAETLVSLGSGFDTGGPLTPEAEKYYDQAAQAFDNILNKVPMNEEKQRQVEARMGIVRSRQRRFEEAMEIFEGILAEANLTLNVQVEAALTLQRWAQHAGGNAEKAQLLRRAISGDRPDPESKSSVVWGFLQIANITAPHEKFRDVFHQARYNLSRSRLLLAQAVQGSERKRQLDLAAKDISITRRLYGLGKDPWPAQYDALLKEIQRLQNKEPIGLKALGSLSRGTSAP